MDAIIDYLDSCEGRKADFGIKDPKGRTLGYTWTAQEITARPKTESDESWYRGIDDKIVAAGKGYSLRYHLTKNGKAFGASNRALYFATLDEALAAGAAKAEEARKRWERSAK